MTEFGIGLAASANEWARGMWNMLNDGGVWGIPRCGLMYRKDEEAMKFVCFERMNWERGVPMTREELREAQDSDHANLVVVFKAIGVEVVDDSFAIRI